MRSSRTMCDPSRNQTEWLDDPDFVSSEIAEESEVVLGHKIYPHRMLTEGCFAALGSNVDGCDQFAHGEIKDVDPVLMHAHLA